MAKASSQYPKILTGSWELVAALVKTDTSENPIGWFVPKRMQDDFQLVKDVFGTKDSGPQEAYTDDYLDPKIKQ